MSRYTGFDLPEPDRVLSFFSNENIEVLAPRRAEAWRVGDAMRKIIDRLVETGVPDDELADVASQMEAIADRLGAHTFGRSYDDYGTERSDGGPPSGHTDYSPLLGRANPIAPPMEFRLEGEMVVADVVFGNAYEGPPGHVHGGLVAAAFDEVLGAMQAMSGQPGMTGTLNVVYRRPTPLHIPLRFEATLDDVQGRKIFCSSRVYSTDAHDPDGEIHLRAESTGVFISIDFAQLAASVKPKL